MYRLASSLGCLIAATVLFSGCKPKYPACETDADCADKGEACVNKVCQECRDDSQCAGKYPGEGRECQSGRCEVKAECQSDDECADQGMVCRSNKCVPECTTDDDCPSDSRCDKQRCVSGAIKVSAACQPTDPRSGDVIALSRVSFDFDKYDLTVSARGALDQNAECLREATGVSIIIEGHADERGTQEYNLALGEKRANTVKTYLRNLGIDTSRMQTRSKGENEPLCRQASESCWSDNRRVEFIQKRGTM